MLFIYADLISYLKSFGTEPTNRVLKPKVVTLPPPALSIASQTTPNTYDHISLPLQARDIADLVFSGSTSANRNQVWITKPSINIRNNDFNETISNTIKPDIMRSMGFNLRPTDCELKLLGMRLLFTNASASESTISLEQSSKSVTTAEPQQCLATVAIQVQSRYTGGEINLRAAQDVSSSSNTSLPSHDYDLSVTSNPSHEWSTVMLCWTDPYDLSQAALSSGCLLRLEYGLFLTSMRTSKGQGLNIESLMSMIGTGGQSVTQSKIIPFGILLVGTYDDSRQYIARGHEALKSRLTDGDQRLLDTIVAANESLPDSERCSIKLASVKLRYKSYAPVTSAKRPGLYGQSLPRANRYYGDSENENSDDEDEDEDEDDEVEDGYEGRYFPTHYYGYPTSSFSGDQQIAINQCLHGFSIRSFEDVHNNVVSAKYHSPHTEQRSDDPSKWNFDFTGALTQLRSDAVSESVGDKRKRDLSNASDGGQVGVVLDDDDDDDVVFMGFTSPSLVLPHMRENCGEFVFSLNGSSTENLKTCEKCFCKSSLDTVIVLNNYFHMSLIILSLYSLYIYRLYLRCLCCKLPLLDVPLLCGIKRHHGAILEVCT